MSSTEKNDKEATLSSSTGSVDKLKQVDSDVQDVPQLEKQKETEKRAEHTTARRVKLDTGTQYVFTREHFWQFWLPKTAPPPPPATFEESEILPLANCSFLSYLTYAWIYPILALGYSRTLQATDLYKLDEKRTTKYLSDGLDAAWERRVVAANEWNAKLEKGEVHPTFWQRTKWSWKALRHPTKYGTTMAEFKKNWYEKDGKKEPSLVWALNDTFGFSFWLGGCIKVFGDTAQLMGPLVIRAIINFGKDRTKADENGTPRPSVGRGVAMAIGLWLIVVNTSTCQHQFYWRSTVAGIGARQAVISSLFKRGVNLTGKGRVAFPNSALVNFISSDVSRIDACAQWFHATWTSPIQVIVCLIVLLTELGPSALAGFSLFLLIIPIQERLMGYQSKMRLKSLVWTDQRAKMLMEILGGMRVVKYFSNEQPFLDRLATIRENEVNDVRKIQRARSANIAVGYSIPVLSATLAFVTYTSTKTNFDVAIIFSSFTLFQLLRQPLMIFPRAASASVDAISGLQRIQKMFMQPLRKGAPFKINPDQELALEVKDATFQWEMSLQVKLLQEKVFKAKRSDREKLKKAAAEAAKKAPPPFQVQGINMAVPRGSLVAIVGAVGSGKSSLLQGLIGEMRTKSGDVSFAGKVAYCPQTAWIMNATVRDNILFGQPWDEARYWKVIEQSCLGPDLKVLGDGDATEIGEKGINLSGGQKQRVNIARALYFDADIVIFDDPLSAVDAHVGKALFSDAIVGALKGAGKTVILVTHALHFLSDVDYVYTLSNGRIAEAGTYTELMEREGEFAHLITEFGGGKSNNESEKTEEEIKPQKKKSDKTAGAKGQGKLIAAEKRSTGSVSWRIYQQYIKAGQGAVTAPLLLACMICMQVAQVLNSYTLIWWQSNTFHHDNSWYQVIYAMLGIAQAVFTFGVGISMDEMGYYVSKNLHNDAINHIFYAPMAFFDTTPAGRILGIFGKDIDSIDNQLPVSMRLFGLTIATLMGAVILVVIVEHYFLIAVAIVAFGYWCLSNFYRASARELKRLDAQLRSLMYAHFSEALSGLPTIRSYGEVDRFIADNQYYVDLQARASWLTATNQRWLAVRLDWLGALMPLVIGLLAVTDVSGISASQIGLVLSYSVSLTQVSTLFTRQSAEVENYMSSVERLVQFSSAEVPQEAPHEIPETKPPPQWPNPGQIEFNDVEMRYRKDMPLVLKGLTLSVKGGEKIGIVGRTGAGKSSLMLALFRIVELSKGSIVIDGIDISKIGLRDLRTKIAMIPQDPLLFSGTVRSNLDPFNQYEDAQLWDALKRSYLVDPEESEKSEKGANVKGFTLDSVIEADGANLSVGERSLLSLARALVKDSQVVVLDEATASVDLETDSKIQQTITTQFSHKTLLCIAHRLRTIIGYDRILVMDQGQIAEYDTPMNLFYKEDSIFRSMCDRSGISSDEMQKASIKAYDS